MARTSGSDGRWAYTLYARRGDEPFVHALDTVKREAFCIDLPLHIGYDGQWSLRLKLDVARGLLSVVLAGRGKVATVDTHTWAVQRSRS